MKLIKKFESYTSNESNGYPVNLSHSVIKSFQNFK
jgi:hypothetical protein